MSRKKAPESGSHPKVLLDPTDCITARGVLTAERNLADLALKSIGHGLDADDDPALSIIDALADDMRVMQIALDSEDVVEGERLVLAARAIDRYMDRLEAIRELHERVSMRLHKTTLKAVAQ